MKIRDKIKRKNSLIRFGFGADVMRCRTVCLECYALENSKRTFCSKCGSQLPEANLYDYYKARHRNCPECGNVLSQNMDYCPRCGVRVKETAVL